MTIETIDAGIAFCRQHEPGTRPEAIYLGRNNLKVLRRDVAASLCTREPNTQRLKYRDINIYIVDADDYIRVV